MTLQVFWTTIGGDGVQASVNAGDVIRYGVGNTWVEMTVPTSGTYILGQSYFGGNDPAYGQSKIVQLKSIIGSADASQLITEAVTKIATKIGEDRTVINRHTGEINALKGRASAVEGVAASKAAIDDSTAGLTSTTTTLSGAKTSQLITDAETRATNAATQAVTGLSTLQAQNLAAIATELAADGNALAGINAEMAKRVSIDSQTFTSAQQAQARTNIGAVSVSEMTTAINNAVTAAVGDPTIVDIDALLSGLPAVA